MTTISITANGAIGDGSPSNVAVNDAAFAATIAAAKAMGGAEIIVPSGVYCTSNPVLLDGSNLHLKDDGAQSSMILNVSPTSDIIAIGDGTQDVNSTGISGVRAWSTVNRVAGAALRATRVKNAIIERNFFGSIDQFYSEGPRLHDGCVFDRFSIVHFYGNQVAGGTGDGLTIYGNAAQTFGVGFFTDPTGFVSNFAGRGFRVSGGCGGVNADLNVQLCGGDCMVVDAVLAGAPNREVILTPNLALDSCMGRGLACMDNATFLLLATAPWIGGHHKEGVYISPTQWATSGGATYRFNAPNIYQNSGPGIFDEGNGSNLEVAGAGNVILNGSPPSGSSPASGIVCKDKFNGSILIAGNKITDNGQGGLGFGLAFVGINKYINVSDNVILRNAQGAVDNQSGFGANQRFDGNVGYVPGGNWTPVIKSLGGSIASAAGTFVYQIIGNRLFFDAQIWIESNGSGSQCLQFTVPIVPTVSPSIHGREIARTGNGLNGFIPAGTNTAWVQNARDGSYPCADGYLLLLSGNYSF